jgi:hypothetical protein
MSAAPQPAAPDDRAIPLREAPKSYFDTAMWLEFLSCFETAEAALRHLSQTEPSVLVHYRRQVAKLPPPDGGRARREERTAELAVHS